MSSDVRAGDGRARSMRKAYGDGRRDFEQMVEGSYIKAYPRQA